MMRALAPWTAAARLLLILAGMGAGCGGGVTQNPTPTSTLTVGFDPVEPVGGGSVVATLRLSPAPAAATTIELTSGNTAVATVPLNVTVPAGSSNATFTITTLQVQIPTTVAIRASGSGASTSADLRVRQIPVCGPFLTAPVVMPLTVYKDHEDQINHFNPSGWFGDVSDLTLTTADSNAQSGSTAIRVDYTPRGPQRFAGVFWECGGPFGAVQNEGFNLTLARQVTFFARATRPARAEFKVGGITGPFGDSLPSTPTSPVIVDLGTDWRQFTINVSGNLSRVIGGFMLVTNTTQNPSGATIYLDEIVWR